MVLVMFVLLEFLNSWLVKVRFWKNVFGIMVSVILGKFFDYISLWDW